MEEMDLQTLFTYRRECDIRIAAAQREIEMCEILAKGFDEEIHIRKNKYTKKKLNEK
tara:strand:+ start:3572 stop:3742 length:171 start_codon:yes stop_codon:yes gene_type:complete